MSASVLWSANPGPQTEYLACSAYEALYGGQAGGGKSECVLVGALRWIHSPNYLGIIFRRHYTELERTLIKRSHSLYRPLGGRYNGSLHAWRFPSGAEILFGHLEHEHSVHEHQGAEYQYIGFDELTHFTEYQYRYMLSRGRSSKSIPIRIRAGTNPGGPGHGWVFKRWGSWLDPEHGDRALPGESRWFAPSDTEGEEIESRYPFSAIGPGDKDGSTVSLSRAFFPARIKDNPKGDPTYETKLRQLDRLSRAQLLEGDWLAKPGAGLLFKRDWFDFVEQFDGAGQRCRYWDRAASIDGDWTVGAKWCREPDGRFVVEDVVRMRGRPADVEAKILATTIADDKLVTVVLEQDPGQAGVSEIDRYVRLLAGYDVRAAKLSGLGDKVTRARPASAQCERHMVRLVRAKWNAEWIDEHEAFPDPSVHDDQVDTTSGAVAWLSGNTPATLEGLSKLMSGSGGRGLGLLR